MPPMAAIRVVATRTSDMAAIQVWVIRAPAQPAAVRVAVLRMQPAVAAAGAGLREVEPREGAFIPQVLRGYRNDSLPA